MTRPTGGAPHAPVLPVLGWREWLSLPDLGVAGIKAKVDTGARTSALHAFWLERYRQGGRSMVRFRLHPLQRNTSVIREARAEILDERVVSDSGGHRERRLVIATTLCVGQWQWPAELTLSNRETMLFRMLLGRTALKGRFVVDPALSYCCGRDLARSYDHEGPS